MESIGLRHLKENLSRYMKQVKSGQPIIVTDRREEIAVIMPFNKAPIKKKILALIQNGSVSWSGGKPSGMTRRIISKGKSVSEAVVEDRR